MREVRTASRKRKRDVGKVLDNDLRKYLAEIVTNSDDSYRRLEHDTGEVDQQKQIVIEVDKSKKLVSVTDNAEGMDEADLFENFEEYGADKSGRSEGHKTRGLYGQGASDVLFNCSLHNKTAIIKSIKNEKLYTCKFLWKDEKQWIDPKESKTHVRDVRGGLGIPDNGSVVLFKLPDNVSIPRDLVDQVRKFYMLRFIFNKPNRHTTLITKTAKKTEKTILHYDFPEISEEKLIIEKDINFSFSGYTITGKLVLYEVESKDEDQYGELKILTYDDEENVYDNTFFGFGDKHPGTENLFGYLQLKGTADIISEKLNQKIPEEILTDSRDGFNRKHEFYKLLETEVDPSVDSALKRINSQRGEPEISLNKQKEWQDAFREINKYFKEELEEDVGGVDIGMQPPAEGLKFIFTRIKITAGKKYSIKLLVNKRVVPLGSRVTISGGGNGVEFSPSEFRLKEEDTFEGSLATKSISINGLEATRDDIELLATSSTGHKAKLFISVINREIHYPRYGMEFWPDSIYIRPNIKSKAHLFIDVKKFPVGSRINFRCDDRRLKLFLNTQAVGHKDLISDMIAEIPCQIESQQNDYVAELVASSGSREAGVKVTVKDHDAPPPGSGGFLSGVKIRKENNQFWQTFYNPTDGNININCGNNVNLLHLGELDLNNPKLTKEQTKYVAELCANESAKQLVKRRIEKGKITLSSTELSTNLETMLDEIQKQKNKLLNLFLKNIEKLIK